MDIIQASHIMLNEPSHVRVKFAPQYDHGSAFVNGKYCSIDEAAIPLTDMGFSQSDATYDVVSTSNGYFFRLDDHLERFQTSCETFRLSNPYSKEETTEILTNLVRLAGTKEAYVWFAVTRGHMPDDGARINPLAWENCFYAYVVPYVYIANDEMRTRGMDLMISKQFIRIPPKAVDPKAKNFHWMDLKLSLFEAHDTGCLEGITRKTTLELAQELGMPIKVEPVHMSQLLDADEAFITSTAGGIMPINSVDGKLLGGLNGPGALTTRLHNLYWEKRWAGWLGTPVDYTKPVDTGL
jgi:branched-chain amino acid aminotransferase